MGKRRFPSLRCAVILGPGINIGGGPTKGAGANEGPATNIGSGPKSGGATNLDGGSVVRLPGSNLGSGPRLTAGTVKPAVGASGWGLRSRELSALLRSSSDSLRNSPTSNCSGCRFRLDIRLLGRPLDNGCNLIKSSD